MFLLFFIPLLALDFNAQHNLVANAQRQKDMTLEMLKARGQPKGL